MFKKFVSANRKAFQKFKSNYWGVFSLVFIILVSIVAVLAYVIAPDNTENANNGDVSISTQHPGFKVDVLKIPFAENKTSFSDYIVGKKINEQSIPILSYSFKNDTLFYKEFSTDPSIAQTKFVLKSSFPTQDESEIQKQFIKTKKYWLGTDNQGRDYLSRLLVGARVSLAIGFVAVFISLVIGISLGAIAGYYGGKTDAAILWLINIYWLWHNLQLTYLYYYSSVLFLTMLSDWLLTLNIVFSLIGILVAIKVLRKKIDLKKGTVINLLLWLLEGVAYFFSA